jgi:uncharacterized protein
VTEDWPERGLDVGALRESGWRPTPFRQFVLKVASRCNLDCDYCYMYHLADQGWRSAPRLMSDAVVAKAAERIAEHAERHDLDRVDVILHGGEPLLAGAERLAAVVSAVRGALPPRTRLAAGMQTNGTLLQRPALDRLAEAGVRIGVSLDGAEADHDRHRRDASDRGSHAATVAGLRLLTAEPYRPMFAGLLAVVDVESDPIRTYESLLEFDPPTIDFLLPHATWASPPAGREVHGQWLATIFDRWYDAPRSQTRVKIFSEIIHLVLGQDSHSDQVGLSPAATVVVNSDGAVEQIDTLRVAYAGATATALTVFANDFDQALAHPAVAARQIGLAALSEECLTCPLVRVCGGGHYAHRYRAGTGFRNPSVYGADLALLIRHIRGRVDRDITRLRERIR